MCGCDAPCVAVYADGRGIECDVEAKGRTAVLALLVLVQGGTDIEEAVVELTLHLTPQVELDVEAVGEDLRHHAEALDLCAACQSCLTGELEFPVLKAQSRSTQLMTTQTKGGDGGL